MALSNTDAANRQQAIDNPESRKAEGLAEELRRNKKTCTEIADKLNNSALE